MDGSNEVIKTLYLDGLPPDVRDREVFNLFRLCPGYESYKTKESKDPERLGRIAFISFTTRQSASNAIQLLNGTYFDPLMPEYVLMARFAKSNSKVKRPVDFDPQEKRKRMNEIPSPSGYNMTWVDPYAPYSPPGFGFGQPNMMPQHMIMGSFGTSVRQPLGQTPCNTIFVRGFNSAVTTQNNLISIFGSINGFVRLKLGNKPGQAFVEYAQISDAQAAQGQFNGFQSEWGQLHVSFAKDPMKAGSSSPVSPPDHSMSQLGRH